MQVILAGKRILVVEDDYLIAADLERALTAHGVVVVGPASNVNKALVLFDDESIDAALLDVNLEGSNSYIVADRLKERLVPYMFLSGYDGGSLPEKYRTIPRLSKPFTMSALLSAIERLLSQTAVP